MKNYTTVDARLIFLEAFFNKIFPGKIKIISLSDNANVIYNDERALSCYVTKESELRFTDAPDKGNVIYSFILSADNKYDVDKIMNWFQNCEHRKMWKVMNENSSPKLFLSGYNFINKIKQEGKYPVFSLHNPKLYFQQSKAEEVVSTLRKEGYSVISC